MALARFFQSRYRIIKNYFNIKVTTHVTKYNCNKPTIPLISVAEWHVAVLGLSNLSNSGKHVPKLHVAFDLMAGGDSYVQAPAKNCRPSICGY